MISVRVLKFFDRVAEWAFGLFICFTYVELLDKCNYLNHYYFVSLVALSRPHSHSYDRPLVPLFMKCFCLLALVYFYAGLAKLNTDWQ